MAFGRKKRKLLLTGFGSFSGLSFNPSADLIKDLRAEILDLPKLKAKFSLRKTAILKTEYSSSLKYFRRLLRESQADVVVCFGLALGERGFRLEQFAHNRCSLKTPDACGKVPHSPTIEAMGPKRIATTLPLPKLLLALKKNKLAARISKDAGSHLCNFIFYQLLRSAKELGFPEKAGFIHIPLPDQKNSLTKAELLKGVLLILLQL